MGLLAVYRCGHALSRCATVCETENYLTRQLVEVYSFSLTTVDQNFFFRKKKPKKQLMACTVFCEFLIDLDFFFLHFFFRES